MLKIAKIQQEYDERGQASICASHEFIDANEVMLNVMIESG